MIRLIPVFLIALALGAQADEIIWPATPPAGVPPEEYPRPNVSLEFFQKSVEDGRSRQVELVFEGDGDGTYQWAYPTGGLDDWKQQNPNLHPFVLFGGPGDRSFRTQYQLWQLQHGELSGLHPKLIVLTSGLGNLNDGDKPEDVAAAIRTELDICRKDCPEAHLVVMGIFPFSWPYNRAVLYAIQETNKLLAKLDDGINITYLDINDKLAHPNGTLLNANLQQYPPGLYEIWAAALQPLIDKYCPNSEADDQKPFPTPITDPEPVWKYPFPRTPPPGVSRAAFPVPYDDTQWFDRYDEVLSQLKSGKFDIVVDGGTEVGSLVFETDNRVPILFSGIFPPGSSADLAIRNDLAANVTWRVRHGQMDGQDPRLVVLVPSADYGNINAHATADGIMMMVSAYEKACPHAHVALLSVMPRGTMPDDPARIAVNDVNALLASAPQDPRVTFLNITNQMLNSDGTLDDRYFGDRLEAHLATAKIFSAAVHPLVNRYCPVQK